VELLGLSWQEKHSIIKRAVGGGFRVELQRFLEVILLFRRSHASCHAMCKQKCSSCEALLDTHSQVVSAQTYAAFARATKQRFRLSA
jgi:hypothetical protein